MRSCTVADNSDNVVAVLVEPVQGEGGIRIPDADYLAGIRALCDKHNWLLMLDEVQTGMGRTGHWFAFQHSDIKPDVMTLAKGLGNGMPIGACLARGAAADLVRTRQSRLHLRRQSAGVQRRIGRDRHHRERKSGRTRRATRPAHARRLSHNS